MKISSESILSWVSVFTLFLIISGNIYISSYYRVFNINIYENIDISEIFTLYLTHLIKLLPWFFSIIIISYVLYTNIGKTKSSTNFEITLWDIIQLIIATSINIISFLFSKHTNYFILNYLLSTVGTIYFCYSIWQLNRKSFNKTKEKKWIYVSIAILLVQSYFVIDSTGNTIARNLMFTKTEFPQKVFYFENDTIKTSSDCKLIGSTSKYIFFYKKVNHNEKKIIVINKDKLLNKTEISMRGSN